MQSSKVNEITKEDMLRVDKKNSKEGALRGSPTFRVKRKERALVETTVEVVEPRECSVL